jgi:hypothetical protein
MPRTGIVYGPAAAVEAAITQMPILQQVLERPDRGSA